MINAAAAAVKGLAKIVCCNDIAKVSTNWLTNGVALAQPEREPDGPVGRGTLVPLEESFGYPSGRAYHILGFGGGAADDAVFDYRDRYRVHAGIIRDGAGCCQAG